MMQNCHCEERSDVAVHVLAPRGLQGGLLHFVRNDWVRFAVTGEVRIDRVKSAMTQGLQ